MDATAYAGHLRRDGFALADAAEGDLARAVPSCPGWDLTQLVWHTGEVHHFWEQVASRRLRDRGDATEAERPAPGELLEWFRRGVERLAETLEHADPAEPVWTWARQKNIAFIQRRMAQETAVHRWDAQAAAGGPQAIDAKLAVDGINEFLDFFLPDEPGRLRGPGGSVHLHSTDEPGEWLVTVSDGSVEVRREHAKGDAAVRGSASDLLLLLWRRASPSDVEVHGDAAELERFLARADLE